MTSKVTIWDTAKNDHKDGYGIKPDNIMAVIDSYDHVQDIVIDATKAIRLYSKLITATDKTFHVVVFSEPDGEAISVKHTFKIPAIVCEQLGRDITPLSLLVHGLRHVLRPGCY